ncbi:MAG TPA: glycosyltransferase [Mobilitalea sp.]|nr:glycosyltransferase [Mobilitalea sp.]
MAKVSIVVPVYNASKYMENCIDCIRNQTIRDIEIILVDDGSTDGSSELCDRYAQKDNRIKVLHQKNAGVSAARNAGIAIATGEYIGFSDADDYMEPDMYETLYHTAVTNGSDLTTVGIWVHLLSGRVVEKYGTGQIYTFRNAEAIKWLLINQKFCFSCYCHLIKAQLCRSVKFDEKRKMHEDRYYTFEILQRAKKICCNDVCKYHYILRENSATAGTFSDKKLDVLYISEHMLKTIQEKYPEDLIYAKMNCLTSYIDVYKGIIKDPYARKAYRAKKNEMHRKICEYSLAACKPYYSKIRLYELFVLQRLSAFYVFLIHTITKGKKVLYMVRSRLTG